MQKNDILTLEITDMSQNGEGIGKADGYTVFVKDTVTGDLAEVKLIKAKKNYGFGRLQQILKPSSFRREAKCHIARPCGGCQLQMMSYEAQLHYKEKKVREDLLRIGGLEKEEIDRVMKPIRGMEDPWRYRNKAIFPIGYDRDGKLTAGFYAGRTHSIIACEDCLLGVPENRTILKILFRWMEKYAILAYDEASGKGLVRHVLIRKGFQTGELLVCLVINGKKLPHGEVLADMLFEAEGMTSLSYSPNETRGNTILGDSYCMVRGSETIRDYIGDICYQISPLSFFQVNPVQTKVLYETALSYADLKGTETVWDLYCGLGSISLFLARKAGQVYGVEIVPPAVEDARKNAAFNGIENVKFYLGKAEEVVPAYYERESSRQQNAAGLHPDVIVVDPPRKGCEEILLETILKMAPERLIYVSCDPATLARDLKYLTGSGYRLEHVQPVDMFPHTVHVETVCLMSRVKE